jgi:hypothetical protein
LFWKEKKDRILVCSFGRQSVVDFMRRGVNLAILKSEGMQPVVSGALMREGRNRSGSPEMMWRREEGTGSYGQVFRRPDITSHRISSGVRGEKEIMA